MLLALGTIMYQVVEVADAREEGATSTGKCTHGVLDWVEGVCLAACCTCKRYRRHKSDVRNLLAALRATMYQMVKVAGGLLWGKTSTGKCNTGSKTSMFGGIFKALAGMLALIGQLGEVIGCTDNADARDEGGRKVCGVVGKLESLIFAGNQ